jgi:peptide/nickel transport system ATP-binding protein
LADEICVMYAGKIVERGSAASVLGHPLHPYTEGLIGSVPSRNRRGAALRQIPGMTPSLLRLPQGCAFRGRCAYVTEACAAEIGMQQPLPQRDVRCIHPRLAAES